MSSIYERQGFLEGGCPTNASEEVTVTVPVTVHAYANCGDIAVNCMGSSVITRNSDSTPGDPGAVSVFTVSQRLRVDIPIGFGADADVGDGHVYFASSGSSDSSDPPTGNRPCNPCSFKCV